MKRIWLFASIFFLVFVNQAMAHTGLESSTPQEGAIINEELKQITLTFESKIEQGSTLELINSKGNSMAPDQIDLNENTMAGSFAKPLESGDYQVSWKVIGADGHPIEGEFSFTIDLPASKTPPEEKIETQVEEQPQSNVEEKANDTIKETETEASQQNKMPSYIVPAIIGVLIIVAGSILLIMKRKK